MKLWLDDVRRPPDDSWFWAQTVDEAIEVMRTRAVTVASLDHDLGFVPDPNVTDATEPMEWPRRGFDGQDGIELVRWMCEHRCFPAVRCDIHSWNPYGARRMAELLAEHCDVPVSVRPYTG